MAQLLLVLYECNLILPEHCPEERELASPFLDGGDDLPWRLTGREAKHQVHRRRRFHGRRTIDRGARHADDGAASPDVRRRLDRCPTPDFELAGNLKAPVCRRPHSADNAFSLLPQLVMPVRLRTCGLQPVRVNAGSSPSLLGQRCTTKPLGQRTELGHCQRCNHESHDE